MILKFIQQIYYSSLEPSSAALIKYTPLRTTFAFRIFSPGFRIEK